MRTVTIAGKTCHLFRQGTDGPVIFWGMQPKGADEAKKTEKYLQDIAEGRAYTLIAYEAQEWNRDFSPWRAPSPSGMQEFAGGGEKTLNWLLNDCIPYIKQSYEAADGKDYFLAGYSLSGLFALWAFYTAGCFRGVACCSGSLWYPGWADFMLQAQAPFQSAVYLSLGGKEEHTRNGLMASIGAATRRQEQYLREDGAVARHKLEWNQGGHFTNPEQRVAKGIGWLVLKSEREKG